MARHRDLTVYYWGVVPRQAIQPGDRVHVKAPDRLPAEHPLEYLEGSDFDATVVEVGITLDGHPAVRVERVNPHGQRLIALTDSQVETLGLQRGCRYVAAIWNVRDHEGKDVELMGSEVETIPVRWLHPLES